MSAAAAIRDYIRILNQRDAIVSSASIFEAGAPEVPFVPRNELLDPDREHTLSSDLVHGFPDCRIAERGRAEKLVKERKPHLVNSQK